MRLEACCKEAKMEEGSVISSSSSSTSASPFTSPDSFTPFTHAHSHAATGGAPPPSSFTPTAQGAMVSEGKTTRFTKCSTCLLLLHMGGPGPHYTRLPTCTTRLPHSFRHNPHHNNRQPSPPACPPLQGGGGSSHGGGGFLSLWWCRWCWCCSKPSYAPSQQLTARA